MSQFKPKSIRSLAFMDEGLLPKQLLEKAHISPDGEYAWRKEDIPVVLEAARSIGLAPVGGQPQFIIPEYICDVHSKKKKGGCSLQALLVGRNIIFRSEFDG
jgi:hypothetical protein